MWWVVNSTPLPFFPGKKNRPILQEVEWVPGAVWKGVENTRTPTCIWSADRSGDSESLYRLRCSRKVPKRRNISTEFQFQSTQHISLNGYLCANSFDVPDLKRFCKERIVALFLLCFTVLIMPSLFRINW